MGRALGPGWERTAVGWALIIGTHHPVVFVVPDAGRLGGWVVEHHDGGPRTVRLPCPTPLAAVDVAHGLQAVGGIAAGANVAFSEEFTTQPTAVPATVAPGCPVLVNLLGQMEFTPRKARRAALDLLRAADEAEGQHDARAEAGR